MENRNIYKMDDFLIIISYLMIIPLTFLAWPWLKNMTEYENLTKFVADAPAVLGSRLSAMALYLLGAVSSQLIGRVIRFGEKQSLEILDTLQFYKKTTISQMSSQLGMSESKISSLVKKMSRISSLGISFDGEIVAIGQKIEESVTSNFNSYSSPSTPEKSEVPSDKNLTDQERREQFKKVALNFAGKKGFTTANGKKFNFVLFIILFITPLWPIALIYAISFAVKQKNAALTENK